MEAGKREILNKREATEQDVATSPCILLFKDNIIVLAWALIHAFWKYLFR